MRFQFIHSVCKQILINYQGHGILQYIRLLKLIIHFAFTLTGGMYRISVLLSILGVILYNLKGQMQVNLSILNRLVKLPWICHESKNVNNRY